MPIQVVMRRSGYGSRGKVVEIGRNLVVFSLYGVEIDSPEASPPHSDVLGPKNGKNLFGLGVHKESFGKKLARNVQNTLSGK